VLISSREVYWNESDFKPGSRFYYRNAKNSRLQSSVDCDSSWKDVLLAGPLNGNGAVADCRTISEIGAGSKGGEVHYRITFGPLGTTEGGEGGAVVYYRSTAALGWYYPEIRNVLADVNTALGLKLGHNTASSAKFWYKIDEEESWIESGVIAAGPGVHTEERSFASQSAGYPARESVEIQLNREHKVHGGIGEAGSIRQVGEFEVCLVATKPSLTLRSEKGLGKLGPSRPGRVELGYSNAIGLDIYEARTYDRRSDWGDPVSSSLEAGTDEWSGAFTAHESGSVQFRLGKRVLVDQDEHNAWYNNDVTQEKVKVTYTYDELAMYETNNEGVGGDWSVIFGGVVALVAFVVVVAFCGVLQTEPLTVGPMSV
jgi:hypothetical protein